MFDQNLKYVIFLILKMLHMPLKMQNLYMIFFILNVLNIQSHEDFTVNHISTSYLWQKFHTQKS